MIRKKFPSANSSKARSQCALRKPTELAAMHRGEAAKRMYGGRFSLRQASVHRSEIVPSEWSGVVSRAWGKWGARQVLPCGRQKTPTKYLKNNEKSSPEFVLRVVQGIESRSASGYGIGVGEWG
jgi:hypothetical protein